jgi:hypothetical protein
MENFLNPRFNGEICRKMMKKRQNCSHFEQALRAAQEMGNYWREGKRGCG